MLGSQFITKLMLQLMLFILSKGLLKLPRVTLELTIEPRQPLNL